MSFFETIHCRSRAHCSVCRNKEGGRKWRDQIMKIFKDITAVDFECPHGIPWEYKKGDPHPAMATKAPARPPPSPGWKPTVSRRPIPTLRQAATFGKAMVSGKYVSKEILEERAAICGKCKFLRVTPEGVKWCGICGCKTSSEERKINNLAAYEENLPHWGCKYPNRPKEGGWER